LEKTDIVIDGRQSDWDGSLYLLKKANVMVGARNDSENLYICFVTNDQAAQREIMRNGLTVWFDPSGGSSERYGIKFPLSAGFNSPKEPGSSGSVASPAGDFSPAIADSANGIKPSPSETFSRTGADDIQKSVQFIITDEDRTQDLSMNLKFPFIKPPKFLLNWRRRMVCWESDSNRILRKRVQAAVPA
jgi:hypothetical protein